MLAVLFAQITFVSVAHRSPAVKLVGTQSDASSGRILDYLLSLAAQPPLGDTLPAANFFQSGASFRECAKAEDSSAKRQREEGVEEAVQQET